MQTQLACLLFHALDMADRKFRIVLIVISLRIATPIPESGEDWAGGLGGGKIFSVFVQLVEFREVADPNDVSAGYDIP